MTTPHGHADVNIASVPAAATLAGLLHSVTGQAAPATARLDGRVVATDMLVSELRLAVGSSIDTRGVVLPDGGEAQPVVRIIQLTGRGAGRTVELAPGRHRFGTSRRLHAPELDMAPIESLGFELEVSTDGDVVVIPGPHLAGAPGPFAARLNQRLLDQSLPWIDGRLSVAGRIFELDDSLARYELLRPRRPEPNGTIPFTRRAGGSRVRRRVIVDALRDANDDAGLLWLRRRKDPGAFALSYGIRSDDDTDATVDLLQHDGVALVGSDRFTVPLARTLIVDAATLHGPADLEIVVATTPDRLAPWNWAKWLPHVRRGDPTSSPDLLTDTDAIERWSRAAVAPSHDGGVHPMTLLVIDDPGLWSRRDSPLRPLFADPPRELRVIAVCPDAHDVPSRCTVTIDEVPPAEAWAARNTTSTPGRPGLFGPVARQRDEVGNDENVHSDIRPALIEADVAADVARRLAPLDDLEAARRPTASRPVAPTLSETIERSVADDADLEVVIGTLLSVPATVRSRSNDARLDLTAPRATTIVCPDPRRRADTVAAVVLGAASQRDPDRLAILALGADFARWFDELPHLAGWTDREETDVARLVHRVNEVLRQRPDMAVLLVAESAYDSTDPLPPRLVDAVIELADQHPRVHLVLTADLPDSLPLDRRERLGAVAAIDRHGRGVLEREARAVSFTGIDRNQPSEDTDGGDEMLVVLPTSRGRAMTPLERRLERIVVPDADEAEHPDAADIARRIASALDAGSQAPLSLLPPPLPDAVDFRDLLRRFPGDAIPLGLVDRPEHAENGVYWWQPGQSSLLVAGTPRSGVSSVLDLIAIGTATRTSADDLHVYAIDGLPQRRRAFALLPHVGDVMGLEDAVSIDALVDALHREAVDRLANRAVTDRPDLLLLIADVGRVRRALPEDRVDDVFARLGKLASEGHQVGVSVVAIAAHVDDLGELVELVGDRLIGDLTGIGERMRLGAPTAGPADRTDRRCWSTDRDRRVQLATPPDDLEAAVVAADPEPADRRRPNSFVPGVHP